MEKEVKNPILKREGNSNVLLSMVVSRAYGGTEIKNVKVINFEDGRVGVSLSFADESIGTFDAIFTDERVFTQQQTTRPLVNVEKLKADHAEYMDRLKQFAAERDGKTAGKVAESVLGKNHANDNLAKAEAKTSTPTTQNPKR